MPIPTLIDKVDNVELIRDELAAILLTESVSQQALAAAAARDSRLWALRVFVERSNPASEFESAPPQLDAIPIVNVAFDSNVFDPSASDVVSRQRATCKYNIDCYGYGISAGVPGGGHVAGDKKAALEAQRAMRLVRNILMSSLYVYLNQRGLIARRWLHGVQMFQPANEPGSQQQYVNNIVGARMTFEVVLNEFAPTGDESNTLELVSAGVRRGETGELFFNAQFNE